MGTLVLVHPRFAPVCSHRKVDPSKQRADNNCKIRFMVLLELSEKRRGHLRPPLRQVKYEYLGWLDGDDFQVTFLTYAHGVARGKLYAVEANFALGNMNPGMPFQGE